MKLPALVLAICLFFTPASLAQQASADAPATKEDIQRYLDTVHSRDLMKKMLEAMKPQMHLIIHQQVSKDQNLPPDFERREQKRVDEMWQSFPIDEMLQAMVPVYEKYFTKSEIDALVKFYSTDTGQQILNKMPEVTAESMKASTAIAQRMVATEVQRVQTDIEQQKQGGPPSKQF